MLGETITQTSNLNTSAKWYSFPRTLVHVRGGIYRGPSLHNLCTNSYFVPLFIQHNPSKLQGRSCVFTLRDFILHVSLSIFKVAFIKDVFASSNLRVLVLNLVDFTRSAKSKIYLCSWITSTLLLVSSEVKIYPLLLNPASKLWHKILVVNSGLSGLCFLAKSNPQHHICTNVNSLYHILSFVVIFAKSMICLSREPWQISIRIKFLLQITEIT